MPRMTDELESVVRETAKTNLTVRACFDEIKALRAELALAHCPPDVEAWKQLVVLAGKTDDQARAIYAITSYYNAMRDTLAASKAREDAAFNKGIDTLARKMHVAYWWKEEIRALKQKQKQKQKQETPPRSELSQELQIKMDRIIDESQETPRGI